MSNAKNNYIQPNVDLSKPPPGYVPRAYRRTGYSRTDYQNSSNQSTLRSTPNNRQTPDSYKYAEEKDVSRPGSCNASYSGANQSNFQNDFYAHYLLKPPPPPPSVSPSSSYSSAAEATTPNPNQMYRYYEMYNTSYAVPPPRSQSSIGASPAVSQQPEEYNVQYNRKYKGYNNRFGRNYSYTPYNRNRKMPQRPRDPPNKNVKKKKPLSQSMPSIKGWSLEDAKRALAVEMEYKRRQKSQSLIVKFPDKELNREIVSKLHGQIENVYFQFPCTQRFCFVTVKENANVNEVMNELNQIQFGDGYLTVEPKKDRDDEIKIGPEDIDPLTLYVGNLAQEVTVEKVHKAYPKNKRIDIGFAKKMRYTRYAFVSFHTVDDAIEAFKKTRSEEMYSKTIIVRFRRLHGTVGLPGEPKPQNTKNKSSEDQAPAASKKSNPFDDLFGDSSAALKEEQLDNYEDMVQDLHSLRLLESAQQNEFDCDSPDNFPDSRVPDAEPVLPQAVLGNVRIKEEPADDDDDDMSPSDESGDQQALNQSYGPPVRVKIEKEAFTLPFVKQEYEFHDKDKRTESLQQLLELTDDDSDFDRKWDDSLKKYAYRPVT